jgi:hypothetical protein
VNYCKKILLFSFLFIINKTNAQTELNVPVNIQQAYKNETRSADGRPGKNYWQNKANYTLNINFNPENRLISGTDEIQYFNNSNDTLKEIWFKLYPNIYKKGSIRMQKINADDLTDGVNIESMKINGYDSNEIKYFIDGTNMIVRIKPLMPKQSIIFTIY